MHYARDRNSAIVADPMYLFPAEQRGRLWYGILPASPATTVGHNEEIRGMTKFIRGAVRAVFVAPSPDAIVAEGGLAIRVSYGGIDCEHRSRRGSSCGTNQATRVCLRAKLSSISKLN